MLTKPRKMDGVFRFELQNIILFLYFSNKGVWQFVFFSEVKIDPV